MIKHIKLYHLPASRSARVRWALYETVGDDFEEEIVPLNQGAQYHPDFLKLNPNHSVPVLEVTMADGEVKRMIESAAMVEWLVDAFPEKKLSPQPSQLNWGRADYLQMLHFGSTWMDMMIWQVHIHEHILPSDQSDAKTIARYRSKFINEVEPQLESRLSKMPYICGEVFSGADIIIGHNVIWASGYNLCQDEVFHTYVSRLNKRPGFQKGFASPKGFAQDLPDLEFLASKFTG